MSTDTPLHIDQFLEWVDFHSTLYSGFAGWLKDKANHATMNELYASLRDFSLPELKDASREHFRKPNSQKANAHTYQLADLLEILSANRSTSEAYQKAMLRALEAPPSGSPDKIVSVVTPPGQKCVTRRDKSV